ncbi:hypothetical protein [Leptospira bandrabouensis]|uniref:hypothetical protein n=1 Tax=Leptospira bandrabouensis TaxID=2484903 RepID=UPI001090B95A|nr:hypothetical protein [Leptospira bandrabouensis]TGN03619.1 hypothetical protein EHR07_17450 [Leptospira bandrabouensis]
MSEIIERLNKLEKKQKHDELERTLLKAKEDINKCYVTYRRSIYEQYESNQEFINQAIKSLEILTKFVLLDEGSNESIIGKKNENNKEFV